MTIRYHLSSLLLPLLLASTGCDLGLPGDPSGAETDDGSSTDDSNDTDAEDGVLDDGADSSGDGGPDPDPGSGPDMPPPTDPGAALGALDGMAYFCHDPEGVGVVLTFASGGVEIHGEGGSAAGSVQVDGESLTLSFPELGYTETTIAMDFALGHLAAFDLPSLACYAVATSLDPGPDPAVFMCPKIEYVPEVGWSENELSLGPNGDVYRRQWTALLQVPDELYWERSGFYVQDGDRVFMYFGQQDVEEVLLSGTLGADTLVVDQLEPEAGPCLLQ